MNEYKDLDDRLQQSDPAKTKNTDPLSDSLLTSATRKTKISLAERIQSLAKRPRQILLGTLATSVASVAAFALVISSTPTPLIQMAASSGNRAAESSALAGDGAMDKMWMPYQVFEYKAGPDLSQQGGSGKVYKLERTGSPEAVLGKVAKLFGVSGSLKKYPDFSDEMPGYFYGESSDPWGYDGKNATVSLWWSGTGSWYYSNPVNYPESRCEITNDEGYCEQWEEILPTPELLPTRAEAVAKALEVFNGTGLSVSESDLRIFMDDWSVNISAALKVDGQDTSIEWYLSWASNGEIANAGGHSVVAKEMGSFSTISATSAVDRLDDWRWFGAPGASLYERFQPSLSNGAVARDNSAEAYESESGSSDVQIEPMPEPIEPEQVTLTITSSENALLTIWDKAGNAWLVPGYIMINDQGWFSSIISLVPGVIELPKEVEYDIMPLPADDSPVSNK
jgi:hypothetical protein